jgi:hypothetical protein
LCCEIEIATIRAKIGQKPSASLIAIAPMISRRLTPRAAFLAAVALFFAQVLLASHQIEHLGYTDEGACDVCLTGNAIGSLLTSSPSTPAFRPAPSLPMRAADYRSVSESFLRPHHARAPPTPVRS